jgi:hypothetical protein
MFLLYAPLPLTNAISCAAMLGICLRGLPCAIQGARVLLSAQGAMSP